VVAVDETGRAWLSVKVMRGSKVVGSTKTGYRNATGNPTSVAWRVPRSVAGPLRFCALAHDPAGKPSKQSCAALKLVG
jgi:hypothetical protein